MRINLSAHRSNSPWTKCLPTPSRPKEYGVVMSQIYTLR